MSVDERSRHKLHARLEEVLGPEEAAVLMEHLPPVGWGDVATKRDLDQLSVLMKRDLEQFRAENKREHETLEYKVMAALRQELLHQTRTFMLAMSGTVVAVGSLAFAAARLV
jgi:hypothetical protein